MPKRRKSRKVKFLSPPSSDSEEDTHCRCICGFNDPTAKRPWLQCIACEAWQHNECMNRTVFTDELEVDYLCEECQPEQHEELLDAVYRGEAPWESRVAERLAMKEEIEEIVRGRVQEVR